MSAAGSVARFRFGLALVGGTYLLMIIAILAADIAYTRRTHFVAAFADERIRYSVKLTLLTCLATTILSLWVAVPLGYFLSRTTFPGKNLVDTLLDIPIVLPPLVIGLSLLIVFQTLPGRLLESWTSQYMGHFLVLCCIPISLGLFGAGMFRHRGLWVMAGVFAAIITVTGLVIAYTRAGSELITSAQQQFGTPITFGIPAVIIAQFIVSAAFAVRTMRVTFDQISPRTEQVARTLGCTPSQAFWKVAIPESRRGIVTAAGIAWARALGEFGPIMVFAGATPFRTEVLSTTVFLEISVGRLEPALAVSLLMVVTAMVILLLMRLFGLRGSTI